MDQRVRISRHPDAITVLDTWIDAANARMPRVACLVVASIKREFYERVDLARCEEHKPEIGRMFGKHGEIDSAADSCCTKRNRLSPRDLKLISDDVEDRFLRFDGFL